LVSQVHRLRTFRRLCRRDIYT